jgi:putative SOS response-associated peptidase YedK
MCGRFTLHHTTKEIAERFDVQKILFGIESRYNIAPSQAVAAITQHDGERVLNGFRWGLVPFWADDPAIGNRMINARAETLREKPSFKRILQRKRCLVPADGFYEWSKNDSANPRDKSLQTKTPLHIKMKSGELFAFAGLWDEWRPKDNKDAEPLRTCTLITSTPNELISQVHHRMAVILQPEFEEAWLDPDLDDPDELMQMLKPYQSSALEMYPVSKRVNTPAFDDESCIAPAQESENQSQLAENLQPRLF